MFSKVAICGSFHRDRNGLKNLIEELESTGCQVISPLNIDFTKEKDGFLFADSESDIDPAEIERFHLRAIKEADFIWLHDPAGYVGISAAFELGFAKAINKPVFSFTEPNESILSSFTRRVESVFKAKKQLS